MVERAARAEAALAFMACFYDEERSELADQISQALRQAAAGGSPEVLEALEQAPSAPRLEPLLVALRRHLDQEARAPGLIEAVAGDLLRDISSWPRSAVIIEAMYRSLDPEKIIETARQLEARIHERFPDSGLERLSGELVAVTRQAAALRRWLAQPHWLLRGAVALCILAMALVAVGLARQLQVEVTGESSDCSRPWRRRSTIWCSWASACSSWSPREARIKRSRVLKAVHELRSLAHVIDMHQLTKDPENLLADYTATASSPQRTMTPFQLTRYLDYCCEGLSLLSKVGAVYVRGRPGPRRPYPL